MDELNDMVREYSKGDTELSLESQFEIIRFNTLVESANKDQAIQLAKDVYKALIVRTSISNKLIAHSWGIPLSDMG